MIYHFEHTADIGDRYNSYVLVTVAGKLSYYVVCVLKLLTYQIDAMSRWVWRHPVAAGAHSTVIFSKSSRTLTASGGKQNTLLQQNALEAKEKELGYTVTILRKQKTTVKCCKKKKISRCVCLPALLYKIFSVLTPICCGHWLVVHELVVENTRIVCF